MADTLLSSIPGISHSHQSALKKGTSFASCRAVQRLYSSVFSTGGFVTASDVLLFPLSDISQRCRLPPQAVQAIVDSIAQALARPPSLLRDVVRNGSELITTGDATLDEMLGGGIRVGMIWEFVGEGQVVAPHASSWGTHTFVFQWSGQDTTSTAALTSCAAPRRARRPQWLSMLPHHLRQSAHYPPDTAPARAPSFSRFGLHSRQHPNKRHKIRFLPPARPLRHPPRVHQRRQSALNPAQTPDHRLARRRRPRRREDIHRYARRPLAQPLRHRGAAACPRGNAPARRSRHQPRDGRVGATP